MSSRTLLKRMTWGDYLNYALLIGFVLLCVYPYYSVVIYAFNESVDANRGSLYLWPRRPTLENFALLLSDSEILRSFLISIYRTVVGVVSSLVLNAMFAYAFSKKDLLFRPLIKWMVVIPMYFTGGMIPLFIALRNLGMINNLLTYVVPYTYGSFIIIILHSFFVTIPASLEEAALIDGAGYGQIFFRIVWPTSTPVLAYIVLFQALFHWNDWFVGATFIFNQDLIPAQTYLLNMIKERSADVMIDPTVMAEREEAGRVTSRSLQMAMIVITTLPILTTYPFLQKYFVKGLMIGSIKG